MQSSARCPAGLPGSSEPHSPASSGSSLQSQGVEAEYLSCEEASDVFMDDWEVPTAAALGMTDEQFDAALQQGVIGNNQTELGEAQVLSCIGACNDYQDQLGDT